MDIGKYIKSKIKKKAISSKEWEVVNEQARTIQEFMSEKRFKFILDFFTDNKNYILDLIARNGVKELVETVNYNDVQRSFKTTKKEQLEEISGKYKFIVEFLNFLENTKNRPKEYLLEQEKGFLEIEESKEG